MQRFAVMITKPNCRRTPPLRCNLMPSTQPTPRTEPMPVSSHSLPTLSVAPAAPVARRPPHSASASAPPWLLLRLASHPAIAAAAARRLCRHAGANRFELQLAPFTARTSARVTVKVRAVVAPPHACSRAASRMRISLRRSGWPLRCVVTSCSAVSHERSAPAYEALPTVLHAILCRSWGRAAPTGLC